MWLHVNSRPRALRQWACTAAAVISGALPVPAAALAPAPATVRYATAGASVSVRFDLPQIRKTADGLVELSLTNAFPAEQAGLPVLPEAVVVIALPGDAQVTECQVTPAETAEIVLTGRVRHGRAAASYSSDPGEPSVPDPKVYGLDTPYPVIAKADWAIEQRGTQRVMNVRLTPLQYLPALDILLVNRRMDVAVTWTTAAVGAKGVEKTRLQARAVVQSLASSTLPAIGRVDYVVITSTDLLATPGPDNFQSLCAARNRGGLIATNVTTDWIYANYSGSRPDGGADNQTRIRNFILDAYQNWGTRYVLLGGTADRVPTRLMYGVVQGVKSDPIASDMYYGCLNGTFDENANGIYGEPWDGEGGQDVDLVAEVYVGRFPVTTVREVANMVRKTLAYENATPEQLRKVCHIGEWLGFGGASEYATPSLEQLRLGGDYDGYATVGFSNAVNTASFAISDNLYDAPGYSWTNTEVIGRFQQNYHVFNHLGHGNWGYCFRLNTGSGADRNAMTGLTNSSYFLAYSQACESGRFDDHTDCLAETLVTATNGPAALVMNTRDGWGVGNSTAGPSQYYHRFFWDELLSGRSWLLGEANQKSKEDVRYAVSFYGGAMRWCYYELTLFGDPALPFGARISTLSPTINFTPLQNQLETQTSYRVSCSFGPAGIYDPDSPELVWRTSLEPELIHTTRMDQVAGACYETFLPSVLQNESIYYRIRAASRAGLTAMVPTEGEYSFRVTSVFSLTVEGYPLASGDVAPPYGVNQIASGNLVRASATLRQILPESQARRCVGWLGSGSVPAAGSSNEVSFVMDQPSTLVWQWTDENAIRQHTLPDGIFETNIWCDVGVTTATVTASDRAPWHGTNFLFTGWYLDGVRVPVTGRATNWVGGIVMDQPHDALALYLPEAQDTDLDLVPDWWEMYYYGTTDHGAADDTDGDDAGLRFEYLARTNPTDPASHPAPPVITVTPLPAVQTVPPPYSVYVTIEDTSLLAVTQVVWQINNGNLQTGTLTVVTPGTNLYVGVLTGAAVSGDQFSYAVQAAGQDGLFAQSAIYTTRLQYASIALGTPLSRTYVTIPPGPVGDLLSISNRGTSTLTWHAYAGFGEYADAQPSPDWNLNASGLPWTRSTARSFSAPASLRTTIVSPPWPQGLGQHAAMTSPSIRLGTNAVLAFSYWISSELDTMRAGYCWDGGIVELSTNGGLDFVQLSGPYTHAISGWYASPWPDGTPCFAGAGDGWHAVSFDLSAFAGTTAILRFHYGADDNTDREGWYVDNIRVAPLAPEEVPGTALAPVADAVVPGAAEALVVAADTSQYNRRWLRLPVLIRSNDPITPVAWYELLFDVRHAPVLFLAAAQATNGSGVVTATGAFVDPDGESRSLSFYYSSDDGATWAAPRLSSASFDHGVAVLNTNAATITHSVPASETPYATNSFSLQWNTRHPSNNVSLAMRMLLRVSATDPSYTNASALATPFPVDNQPPDTPALHLFTLQPRAWSAARRLTFNWNTADGAGIGLRDTRATLWRSGEVTNVTTQVFATPPALLSFDCDVDSTNWWLLVQARDRMGNVATNTAGPFWVDATPPDSGLARLGTSCGRFGNYLTAYRVPLTGTNFTDALSGIVSYTYENTTRPDAPPVSTNTAQLDWGALAWGVTNYFRITATDCAGNCSAPAAIGVLVLDPLADADEDGILNGNEELIGSSPFVTSPPFSMTQGDVWPATGLRLSWPSAVGSHYTVECATQLTGAAWSAVPGLANLSGTNGVMSVVVPCTGGGGFFRVQITP